MWVWIWLGVVAASLIIEFSTMEMVSIWFVVGGVISMILASLNVMFEIQITVFIVVSLIFLLVLRKPLLKKISKPVQKTNSDSLIGKTVELLSDIKFNEDGTVKINGVIWSATTENDEELTSGTIVEITSIKGNKIIVEKSKKIKENK